MFKKRVPDGLVAAIENGSVEEVQSFLQNGIDPNMRDRKNEGRPLIAIAAIHGHLQIVSMLIEYGAQIDRRDDHGRTPLSWAVEHCQFDAVKLLINHNANVNAEDVEWMTPLAWLFSGPNDAITNRLHDYLISQGAKDTLTHSFWDRFTYSVGKRWTLIRKTFTQKT
jgi:ankyrin repeat protein